MDVEMKKEENTNEILDSFSEIVASINSKDYSSEEDLQNLSEEYKRLDTDLKPGIGIKVISTLDKELDKLKFLLYTNECRFLPYIKDEFYRYQIARLSYSDNFNMEDISEVVNGALTIYDLHMAKIACLADDKEKSNYIVREVKDDAMKEAMLRSNLITDRTYRKNVIASFKRAVDPQIKEEDELARAMIRTFVKDKLGTNFTDDMQEVMDTVFSRTSVRCNYSSTSFSSSRSTLRKIICIYKKEKNNNKGLVTKLLIREYASLFSLRNTNYTLENACLNIERGMVDVFVDTVVAHYLAKHKELPLNIDTVGFVESDNQYLAEDTKASSSNAIARTLLAGLYSNGNDPKALGMYFFGEKDEFARMVFGDEILKKMRTTRFGHKIIEYNVWQILASPKLDFPTQKIEEDNAFVYSKNNPILGFLPAIALIEKVLGPEAHVVENVVNGEKYSATFITAKFFKGKRFYDVPIEEFSTFFESLNSSYDTSNKGPITDIEDFWECLLDLNTEQEIIPNSYAILERIPLIFSGIFTNRGNTLEKTIKIALEEELRKVKTGGQSTDVTQGKIEFIRTNYINRDYSMRKVFSASIRGYANEYCAEAQSYITFGDGPYFA